MIRNLKILIAAAMALTAFGAFSSSAHAADEFHCSVEPCTLTLAPDEAAGTTTAHHVFVVKGETNGGVKGASVSFTCDQLTGEATVEKKTSTDATFKNLKYENAAGEDKCKIGAAETVTVDMNGCTYTFTAEGGTTDEAELHVLCPLGAGIEITVKSTACLKVTPFTTKGIGYHDADTVTNKHEVLTATPIVHIPVEAVDLVNVGNANCAAVNLKKIEEAKYTTGNTLVKAETDSATPVAANVWYT